MRTTAGKMLTLMMVLLVVLLAACAPTPPLPTPAPKPTPTVEWGIIEVRVTDALAKDISKIVVKVKNIEVHRAGVGEGKPGEEGSWITVATDPSSFDLVELAKGGLEKLLGQKEIAAGKYTQIRMEVTSVVVTIKGEDKPATVPSRELKVVRPFDVEVNKVTTLTLDFDADKSTVITGKGDVKFKPVVKLLVKKGAKPEVTPSPKPTSEKLAKIEGVIEAIDIKASMVTISSKGETVTLIITKDTLIEKDEKPAKIEDLAKGDEVKASYNPETKEAIEITVKSLKPSPKPKP